jgi:hypothetical protein
MVEFQSRWSSNGKENNVVSQGYAGRGISKTGKLELEA